MSNPLRAHPLRERKDDLYETPTVAVEAFRAHEPLPLCLWEPACGPGAIVRTLRAAGHIVHASDLVDYGCPDSRARVDFLMERESPPGCEGIITNPPYKLANQFVEHALSLCPRVYMLLRLAFLESDRRRKILDTGMLARVYVFRNRLPMMHRHDWTGQRTSSAVAFAWFVWMRGHVGPAQIERISWKTAPSMSA